MVGSTYVSVPPLGNAPFPSQVRHLRAELRLHGQAIAGRQKELRKMCTQGGSLGALAEIRANLEPADRLEPETPKVPPVTLGAALLASALRMWLLRRS